MCDSEIRAKWKSEIREQQKDIPLDQQLSENMVRISFCEPRGTSGRLVTATGRVYLRGTRGLRLPAG
jgi:hypothetical protein